MPSFGNAVYKRFVSGAFSMKGCLIFFCITDTDFSYDMYVVLDGANMKQG
jgi:hypothetical protein